MNCVGKCKFKSLERKPAGSFKNANGQVVDYPASYRIKVDVVTENGIEERMYKISEKEDQLISDFSSLDAYTDVEIEFNVVEYQNRVVLQPIKVY